MFSNENKSEAVSSENLSRSEAANEPKAPSFYDYLPSSDDVWSATKTAANWAILGTSIAFLGALYLNPAMIPFGIAQVGFWMKSVEIATAAALFAYTGYHAVSQVVASITAFHARNTNQELTTAEKIAMGAVTITTAAFVAAMFAPSLPFGLAALAAQSLWIKLAATAVAAAPATYAARAAMPNSFWAAPASQQQPADPAATAQVQPQSGAKLV